jgi:superfamily II DNA or RNA helicase
MAFFPSIVPESSDHDVYLVLDNLGQQLGRIWRETDEENTDYETAIHQLLQGSCSKSRSGYRVQHDRRLVA